MNPDHTPTEAAQAELERFDRLTDALGDSPVRLVAPMLRQPIQDLKAIIDHAYRRRGLANPPAAAIIREPSGAGDAENVPTPGPSTSGAGTAMNQSTQSRGAAGNQARRPNPGDDA